MGQDSSSLAFRPSPRSPRRQSLFTGKKNHYTYIDKSKLANKLDLTKRAAEKERLRLEEPTKLKTIYEERSKTDKSKETHVEVEAKPYKSDCSGKSAKKDHIKGKKTSKSRNESIDINLSKSQDKQPKKVNMSNEHSTFEETIDGSIHRINQSLERRGQRQSKSGENAVKMQPTSERLRENTDRRKKSSKHNKTSKNYEDNEKPSKNYEDNDKPSKNYEDKRLQNQASFEKTSDKRFRSRITRDDNIHRKQSQLEEKYKIRLNIDQETHKNLTESYKSEKVANNNTTPSTSSEIPKEQLRSRRSSKDKHTHRRHTKQEGTSEPHTHRNHMKQEGTTEPHKHRNHMKKDRTTDRHTHRRHMKQDGTTERQVTSEDRLERQVTSEDRLERQVTSEDRLERQVTSEDRLERQVTSEDRLERQVTSEDRLERRATPQETLDLHITSVDTVEQQLSQEEMISKHNSKLTFKTEKSNQKVRTPLQTDFVPDRSYSNNASTQTMAVQHFNRNTPPKSSKNTIWQHFAKVGYLYRRLYMQNQFTDVIIHVDEYDFNAHKAILMAYSTKFCQYFLHTDGFGMKEMAVYGISPIVFAAVLEYMYTEEVNLADENVEDIYDAAKELLMTDLLVKCEKNSNYLNDIHRPDFDVSRISIPSLESTEENSHLEHHTKPAKVFHILYERNLFTDVTIHIDQYRFTAHKTLLMAHSDYFFRRFLDTDTDARASIAVTGIPANSFQDVLEFMYTAKINLTDETVAEIRHTAKHLVMKTLMEKCDELISERNTINTLFGY